MIHADKYRRDDDDRPRNSWDYGDEEDYQIGPVAAEQSDLDERMNDILRPALASNYLGYINDYSPEQFPNGVLAAARVSPHNSFDKVNPIVRLKQYELDIRMALALMGFRVLDFGGEVAHGWNFDARPVLDRLARKARNVKSPIIFHYTNRVLRHRDYWKTLQLPTAECFRRLTARYSGISLMTLYPPDTPENEIRAHMQKLGKEFGSSKLCPARIRAYWWDMASQWFSNGISLREIHRRSGVPTATVEGWISKMKDDLDAHGIILGPERRDRGAH